MVTNQKAQKEVERLKANISFLPNLSITLCFFGGLVIVFGIFCIFNGYAALNSYDEASKLAVESLIYSGIAEVMKLEAKIILYSGYAEVISGIFLLFFSAIGEAINDIRIHTIADFNLRHEDIEATKMEEKEQIANENQSTCKKEELITYNFKMGDYVTHKKYGGKMKVVGIKNNSIACDRGWFSGTVSIDASELEPYKE